MFVRIFSSRRVPIYCVNLVLVSSNDPFVMLGPLSVFFVILVTVFTCYFRAIKMMNIKRIVYSSIECLQCKRQLHIPWLKDGDHEEPSKDRPLPILTVALKICEKVALQQFSNYLQRNGLLNKHQSGNLKYHSTETLSIMISDFLLDAMDNKRLSALVQY